MRRLRVVQGILWAGVAVALAVVAIALSGVLTRFVPARPDTVTSAGSGRPQVGGPFRLVSHTGVEVTDSTLRGKPFGMFFGFTHCPDVCPTALIELTERLKELGSDADGITFVFVTVDPERDTREVLASYMQSFDPRILALTGTSEEVAAILKAYKAYARKVPTGSGNYTMDHTALAYLMDRKGAFRNTLDFHENKEVQLAKLRLALRE